MKASWLRQVSANLDFVDGVAGAAEGAGAGAGAADAGAADGEDGGGLRC